MPTDPTTQFFLSLAVNAVVSVLCSWIVAAIYFRKKTPAELVSDQIRHGLQRALIPILHPQFFNQDTSIVLYPEQYPPKNADIPHVEYARLTPRIIYRGTRVDVLMKVLDLGYDLDNPGGVSVRDHNGTTLGVIGIGLGFCKFSVPIPESVESGPLPITIELTDGGGHTRGRPNRNVQTLTCTIEGKNHD